MTQAILVSAAAFIALNVGLIAGKFISEPFISYLNWVL